MRDGEHHEPVLLELDGVGQHIDCVVGRRARSMMESGWREDEERYLCQ